MGKVIIVANRLYYNELKGLYPTHKGLLLAYYDGILNTRTATDLKPYKRARKVIAKFWGKIYGFIVDVAKAVKASVSSLVDLLKSPQVVDFFTYFNWDFASIYRLLKMGYDAYKKVWKAISDYVAETRVMRWTKDELEKLDAYLDEHPNTRRLSGVLVAAMLVYLFFYVEWTGDFDWDFDLSDVIDALGGSYSLSQIFAGSNGSKLLIAIAMGTIGVGFPWPGSSSAQFIAAIIKTIANKIRERLSPAKQKPEDEIQELYEEGEIAL